MTEINNKQSDTTGTRGISFSNVLISWAKGIFIGVAFTLVILSIQLSVGYKFLGFDLNWFISTSAGSLAFISALYAGIRLMKKA